MCVCYVLVLSLRSCLLVCCFGVLLYVQSQILDDCTIQHCAQCEEFEGGEGCNHCEEGYYLHTAYECRECSDQNCATCEYESDGFTICNTCKLGYFLNPEIECQECNTGCDECSDQVNCTTCAEGYSINSEGLCDLSLEVHPRKQYYGPEAGGTVVLVTGAHLPSSGELLLDTAASNEQLCEEIYGSPANIRCVTKRLENSTLLNQPLDMTLSWQNRRLQVDLNMTFTYKDNPEIDSLFPLNAIVSGGTTVTVVGSHLTSVQDPQLITTITQNITQYTEAIHTSCVIRKSTQMDCSAANISHLVTDPNDSETGKENRHSTEDLDIYLGFKLDGLDTYTDLRSSNLSEYARMTYIANPRVDGIKDDVVTVRTWWPNKVQSVSASGDFRNLGDLEDQIEINISLYRTTQIILTDTHIQFTPPEEEPEIAAGLHGNSDEGRHDIVMTLGSYQVTLGKLQYESSIIQCVWCSAVLFGGAALCAVVLGVVVVVVIVKRCR